MNKTLAMILMIGVAACGCDRRQQAVAPPPSSAAPANAAAAPQTQSAEQPDLAAIEAQNAADANWQALKSGGISFFVMDGATTRIHDFPKARLRLTKEGDKLAAVLYSDDPKTAISSDYSGNSFFLEMTLDIDDSQKLSGADWQYVDTTSEQHEPGQGLFLDGNRIHLQPSEAGATFSNANSKTVQVRVYGQFRKFDTDQPDKSSLVRINGEFTATIDPTK